MVDRGVSKYSDPGNAVAVAKSPGSAWAPSKAGLPSASRSPHGRWSRRPNSDSPIFTDAMGSLRKSTGMVFRPIPEVWLCPLAYSALLILTLF